MGQENKNQTWVSEFILLGLSRDWGIQVSLFVLILAMYLVTIVGNALMLLLIRLDSRLHTPMYFFLSVLSFVDLCYANSIAPQMLAHLLSAPKSIPFPSCVFQLYTSLALGGSEFFLLGAMAYDRYVAVCCPLHYTVLMHKGLCLGLAAGCLVAGFMNSLMETIITFRLPLCHNVINHFACETLAVLRLACVDISFNKVMVAISGFLVIMIPCSLVLFSYVRIVTAILHIRSTQGRSKAFGTCASHLTVVCMCFGATIFTYLGPQSASSVEEEKMVALFYAVVAPMLNPLIYSLRNKEVMAALQKVLEKFRKRITGKMGI
uniref:Olfactory receptor n=1 Tax=Prolemur simus TaxID=1328070 RepID=A0A8C8YE59_PROSS